MSDPTPGTASPASSAGPKKGAFNGECNRGACSNTGAVYFNRSTERYYCYDCARTLNRANPEAMELYGGALCIGPSDPAHPHHAASIGGQPKEVALPRRMFDHVGERFLVALRPDGRAESDGGHSDPQGVAKARELFQSLTVIRPPEGTRYLMLTIEEVPPFTGTLNAEAVALNNHAHRIVTAKGSAHV